MAKSKNRNTKTPTGSSRPVPEVPAHHPPTATVPGPLRAGAYDQNPGTTVTKHPTPKMDMGTVRSKAEGGIGAKSRTTKDSSTPIAIPKDTRTHV